jgi:hypothetical protein
MSEIFFDYLKEKDRVVVENNETRAKVMALRNGKKVANSSKNGCFKSKLPVVVLAVSKHTDVEIFQVEKNGDGLNVRRTFYGKVPFRDKVQLENFYVMYCVSVYPYRKQLERLFEEASGKKFTKEEIAAFVNQFNARYSFNHRINPVQSAA